MVGPVGLPDETAIMIPTPIAASTITTIHIGDRRCRMPVFHKPMIAAITSTTKPTRYKFTNYM